MRSQSGNPPVYGTLTEYRCTGYSPSCAAPRITAFIASTADSIASPPTPLTDEVPLAFSSFSLTMSYAFTKGKKAGQKMVAWNSTLTMGQSSFTIYIYSKGK